MFRASGFKSREIRDGQCPDRERHTMESAKQATSTCSGPAGTGSLFASQRAEDPHTLRRLVFGRVESLQSLMAKVLAAKRSSTKSRNYDTSSYPDECILTLAIWCRLCGRIFGMSSFLRNIHVCE